MQCNGGINSFAYVSSKRPMATLRRTLHGFAICSLAFDSPSTSGCSRPDVASSSSALLDHTGSARDFAALSGPSMAGEFKSRAL